MSTNTYYIFKIKDDIAKINSKIVKETTLILTAGQSIRLFGTDYLADKEVSLYEIAPENNDLYSAIISNHYYSDCNLEINNLLSSNKNLYGYSSCHLNSILKQIITIERTGRVSLLGENGWPSLGALFKTLNKLNSSYVVLRKFETLPISFLDGDHDIDLLCNNLQEMVLITGATKRNIGISSYQLNINGEQTDFDIRFVGDNYIDSAWANHILQSRQINQNGISVMSTENQLFSILYHCLTQKKSISKYYLGEIRRLTRLLFGKDLPASVNVLRELLAYFMKSNAYTCPKPKDVSVVQHKENLKIIKRNLKNTSFKNELVRTIYIKTPSKIKNKIPENTRHSIYNI